VKAVRPGLHRSVHDDARSLAEFGGKGGRLNFEFLNRIDEMKL
jgi:hypothetical protein